MNQAALHALLASRANTEGLKKLFDLRLATNATLIKELYFSLYPKDEVAFEKLLDVLKSLFEKRPENIMQIFALDFALFNFSKFHV